MIYESNMYYTDSMYLKPASLVSNFFVCISYNPKFSSGFMYICIHAIVIYSGFTNVTQYWVNQMLSACNLSSFHFI